MNAMTDGTQPPSRGRISAWALWTKSRPAVLYLLTTSTFALLVGAFSLADGTVTSSDLVKLVVMVGLGVVAAEISRRVERMRRMMTDAPHVNLSSVWTLSAALTLPPGLTAALVVLLYSHLWFRSWRRLPGFHPYRVVFNAANVILCCQVAGWAAQYLHLRPLDLSRPWLTVGSFLVVISLYFVLNSAIAAAAIALLQSDRSLVRLMGKGSENLLELATLCVGVLTAVLFAVGAPLIVLVYLPLYALHQSVLVRQFELAALTDQKTGLLNAVSWTTFANKALERARRDTKSASVLMIDIDFFKRINDEHGHLTGDKVLTAVVDALRAETRSYDLCGRFGGEEFVVLLPGAGSDAAVRVANRIRESVHTVEVDDVDDVTVSIGVADFPAAGEELGALLLGADNALLVAKGMGRDQVRTVQSF
jgi:diguanylate cyclase (GGDEF)-like protein